MPFSFSAPSSQGTGALPSYVQTLNPRQKEAVLATEGPLIVLAGAGSGKTKMLTSRIAYLMDVGRVAPHQILAVTFTNKAAGEMRERVARHLEDRGVLGSPEIGTFHSVCVRILRKEFAATPFQKPFVIYDDSDQLTLIKAVLAKLGIDPKSFSPKSFQGSINRLKCDAIDPSELEPAPHSIFEKKLKQVYEQYQKDLFANNALDFGEILSMTYRIFRDHPEIRAHYQRRFRYVHVDEYQDTNRVQYLILALLTQKKHGGHENLCVVGDEDQSIYKWRGADIKNILDFETDFPNSKVVKLEQNYRSTQTIISAAGEVIRNNTQRKDKTLWTENESGTPIVWAQLPDERAEAEMVVSEVKKQAEADGRAYGDFAVFYRTHAQSRQFEDVLRREKIPYQVVGGLRFYDRKEIKDILAYFRAILNPADSISLKRIINVPARGIGKTTLEKIDAFAIELQESEGADYWTAIQKAVQNSSVLSGAAAKKVGRFVELMDRLMQEQPKLLLSELYYLILDETEYVLQLKKEGTEESAARIENLEEFDTLLQEFEEEQFEGLDEEQRDVKKTVLLPTFVEQSMLASERDAGDPGESTVKMMSLHSSKGLEFPVVFLSGMEEGLFPSVKAWEEADEEEIEEERRLCYVGMTRAREILFLSHAVVRRIWGQIHYQEPARFLTEISPDWLEVRNFIQGQSSQIFRRGSSRHLGGFGESEAQAFEFSQLPEESANPVGARIRHPDYGPGTVIAADGKGDDQRLTIEFAGRQQKKFIFKYIRSLFEGDL